MCKCYQIMHSWKLGSNWFNSVQVIDNFLGGNLFFDTLYSRHPVDNRWLVFTAAYDYEMTSIELIPCILKTEVSEPGQFLVLFPEFVHFLSYFPKYCF